MVGFAPNYPMIGDTDLNVSKLYGMLPAATGGDSAGRTAADNQTVRNVFVIGPDKKVKLVLVYPMTTGRNFDEILRVINSLQLTAKHRVATPANWKQGEDVILAGSVTDDEARKLYPQGWKALKPYLASCRSRRRSAPNLHRCPGAAWARSPGATISALEPQARARHVVAARRDKPAFQEQP